MAPRVEIKAITLENLSMTGLDVGTLHSIYSTQSLDIQFEV
jgi:hypothetical protein